MARGDEKAWRRWERRMVAFRRGRSGSPLTSLPVLAMFLACVWSLRGNGDITTGTGWAGLSPPTLIQEVIIVLATMPPRCTLCYHHQHQQRLAHQSDQRPHAPLHQEEFVLLSRDNLRTVKRSNEPNQLKGHVKMAMNTFFFVSQ